ncbi:unnamed protein product [Rhizophagus irregularis]|nr:unnamed protein product [Rhizophagus irregularis]
MTDKGYFSFQRAYPQLFITSIMGWTSIVSIYIVIIFYFRLSALKASRYLFYASFFSGCSFSIHDSHYLISNKLCFTFSSFCTTSGAGFKKGHLQIQHSVTSLYTFKSPGAIIISAGADKSS